MEKTTASPLIWTKTTYTATFKGRTLQSEYFNMPTGMRIRHLPVTPGQDAWMQWKLYNSEGNFIFARASFADIKAHAQKISATL